MALQEELLDITDIQGNILAGFNKDFQVFLFLQMSADERAGPATRAWLRWITPQVSTVAEVADFNRLFKAMRRRQGGDPHGLIATWVNIAFSATALRRLTSPADIDQFVDQQFKEGLAAFSGGLGDPKDTTSPGHPQNWVVGGPNNAADVVVIIASDDPNQLAQRIAVIKSLLPSELREIYEQPGETLPPPLTGHEHFGFKDGISQPGIRGFLQDFPPTFLTPRRIDPAKTPQDDPTLAEFAEPGQPLVWAGQFVFGYRRQNPAKPRNPPEAPNEIANGCPSWGRNGSYLVIRRLRQDVPAFRAFVRAQANSLKNRPGFTDLTATRFASMCVGRWPSGAPIARTPLVDNLPLAADGNANNFFQYVRDSPPAFPLLPEENYAGDAFPTSKRDGKGIACPFSGHVRKVNPRDTTTEQGNSVDVLARLVLRRGIPFGPTYPGNLEQDGFVTPADRDAERGLMFVAYQTSIESQFAFLQKNWANDPFHPSEAGGHDPIIGQRDRSAGGARTFDVRADGEPTQTIEFAKDWVIPTGGGYFFSPSISAIVNVLSKDP